MEFQRTIGSTMLQNFTGNLFGGSGVVNSVKLENSGKGAFLYTNRICSTYLKDNFNEPTFLMKGKRFIGWSDDPKILSCYLGISLWRLLKIQGLKNWKKNPAKEHLTNTIRYALFAAKPNVPYVFLLAILSDPGVTMNSRDAIGKIFGVKKQDFIRFRKQIAELSAISDFALIKSIAKQDSSIY